MPSQKQLQWSQLRVGLTVIFASAVLVALIFLMSNTTGLFTRKIVLHSYFDNASGLRVGAPVRLDGVDIGNVTSIRVVPGRPLTPVEITMRVSTQYSFNLHKDSVTSLNTAGVLGETFVDIDSAKAREALAQDGDVLPIRDRPDFQELVRSSQGTLQNLDALLQRVSRILSVIESGQGSVGKLINDPGLYNRLNATVSEMQNIVTKVDQGQGTIGKLLSDEELYHKVDGAVDKLSAMVDEINQGKGTAGKFIKDPALYDNANQTLAKANQLMTDINAGKGTLGKLAKDEALANKLDESVTRLNVILSRLEKGEGTAGKLMVDPSLYNNADATLASTHDLIEAIRKDPKKYLTIHLKVF